MTTQSSQLVLDSYAGLAGSMEAFTEAFYNRLFRVAPALRRMFPADMTRQRQHLAAAVAIVARNADHLDDLAETLRELGARHAAFGTRPEHYPVVGGVLLDTLAEAAGPIWNEQTGDAWRALIEHVCTLMIEGAEAAEKKPPVFRPVEAEPTH